jgi:hypothetical protein
LQVTFQEVPELLIVQAYVVDGVEIRTIFASTNWSLVLLFVPVEMLLVALVMLVVEATAVPLGHWKLPEHCKPAFLNRTHNWYVSDGRLPL